MTDYTVTVNGKSYDVIVQKKKEILNTFTEGTNLLTATPLKSVPVTGTAKITLPTGEGEKVTAPMPGRIIEIKVHVGDHVTKGQAVLIMEAMKMHNSILAAKEGIIGQLFVKVNDSVQSGQSLLSIR